MTREVSPCFVIDEKRTEHRANVPWREKDNWRSIILRPTIANLKFFATENITIWLDFSRCPFKETEKIHLRIVVSEPCFLRMAPRPFLVGPISFLYKLIFLFLIKLKWIPACVFLFPPEAFPIVFEFRNLLKSVRPSGVHFRPQQHGMADACRGGLLQTLLSGSSHVTMSQLWLGKTFLS